MIEAQPVYPSLKEIFGDANYAWDLLQYQIKFELSSQSSGIDISHILQLYMRGVEKMNSIADIRQSYFKNKVTSLMSRPSVIKTLNKPMSKKSQAPIVESEPVKKIDSKTQIHLQQKRKQMELRLAYGTQQHNQDNLKKLISQHSQKQQYLTEKINKIVGDHDQKLMKRLKERKLRTITAKSRSVVNHNDGEGQDQFSKQQLQRKRDQQSFLKMDVENGKKTRKKRHSSLPSSIKFKHKEKERQKQEEQIIQIQEQQRHSPPRRRVTVDFRWKVPQE